MCLAFSNTARRFPSPLDAQRVIALPVLSVYVLSLRTLEIFAVNAAPGYAKVNAAVANWDGVAKTTTSRKSIWNRTSTAAERKFTSTKRLNHCFFVFHLSPHFNMRSL
jgi:hypothetical protein